MNASFLPGFEEEAAVFEHDGPAAEQGTIDRVSILFPLPLPEPFDYRAPSSWDLEPGHHVYAPLGPNIYLGVVWAVERDAPGAANLKAVAEKLPAPPLPDETRRFVDWTAKYICTPPGNVLRMVVRSQEALLPSPRIAMYAPSETANIKMTEARAKVLAEAAIEPASGAALAKRAGVTGSVVKGLIEAGALTKIERDEDQPFAPPDLRAKGKDLSETQASAVEELKAQVRAEGFNVSLLDGVTGSGKTEVYLEAVAEALEADPTAQALVLLSYFF